MEYTSTPYGLMRCTCFDAYAGVKPPCPAHGQIIGKWTSKPLSSPLTEERVRQLIRDELVARDQDKQDIKGPLAVDLNDKKDAERLRFVIENKVLLVYGENRLCAMSTTNSHWASREYGDELRLKTRLDAFRCAVDFLIDPNNEWDWE